MCDAAIGGKNGVDFKGVKNILGSFYEPDHILVCLDFLASLPQREKINGYAEIIKSRILTGGDFSELGTPSFFSAHLPFLIRETAIHKTEITASDPYDKGIRQCLNFGHTIGHALESYSLTTPNPLLHGEAIAAGMIMEAYLSMKKFNLSEKWFNALLSTIHVYYLPIKAPHWHVLSHYIYHDKKNSGGQIRMSLMETTTNCAYGVLVSTQEVQLALSYYSQLYQ
jgi:3-dehydroquinate synthase